MCNGAILERRNEFFVLRFDKWIIQIYLHAYELFLKIKFNFSCWRDCFSLLLEDRHCLYQLNYYFLCFREMWDPFL